MDSSVFWVITRPKMVWNRCFGTTYRSHLQWSWPLMMQPISWSRKVVFKLPSSFGETAQRGPVPPHFWGFWITHSDRTQSVGLLWRVIGRSQKPRADNKYHTTYRHPCPPAEFEPAIPANDPPQTLALDRSAKPPYVASHPRRRNNSNVTWSLDRLWWKVAVLRDCHRSKFCTSQFCLVWGFSLHLTDNE